MIRLTCVAGLLAVVVLSAEARAGGPPPICMAVDKIVMEPSEKVPMRIKIWGTFVLLGETGAKYEAPVRGYLYYSVTPEKEEECRREWAHLQKLAAEDQIVAYGICGFPKMADQLRKPAEKSVAPSIFPLSPTGFTPAEQYVNHASLKELLAVAAPLSPADGEHVMAGRVTLTARRIRDKEHATARYVFEIQNASGKKEESPPIAAAEKRTEWSPKMEVKAGEKYSWHVRAMQGTWQGPPSSSSFYGIARPQ